MDNTHLQKKRKRNAYDYLEVVVDLPPRRSRRLRYPEAIIDTPSTQRKRSLCSSRIKRGINCAWTYEEDSLLIKAVKVNKGRNWKKISEGIRTKTSTQCLHRWQKVLDPSLVKGPWTEEEDKRLIELVETLGAEKWSYISSFLPGRIGKQCRERWFNHLNPKVKKANWLKEEEWILYILHRRMGNHWSKLTHYLPGRTDNTIKNHWNSTMKKKIRELTHEYEQMIQDKSDGEIIDMENELIESFKQTIINENEKFYNTKMKNYEMFKNTNVNTPSIKKLKKILNFRTHSKKVKKRGRKKKNHLLSETKTIIKETPIKNLKPYIAQSRAKDYHEGNANAALLVQTKNFSTTNEKTFSNNKLKGFILSGSKRKKQAIMESFTQYKDECDDSLDKMITAREMDEMMRKNVIISGNETTPHKRMGFFSNSNTFKKAFNYNNRLTTSNKKFDSNIFNTNYYEYSANKSFNTPIYRKYINGYQESEHKLNNANLDKMFFSTILVDNENDSPPVKEDCGGSARNSHKKKEKDSSH